MTTNTRAPKVRTLEEVRTLLDQIAPLLERPFMARGKTDPMDRSVSTTFSRLGSDVDLGLFYGFVTHAPLMVRELGAQLAEALEEIERLLPSDDAVQLRIK